MSASSATPGSASNGSVTFTAASKFWISDGGRGVPDPGRPYPSRTVRGRGRVPSAAELPWPSAG